MFSSTNFLFALIIILATVVLMIDDSHEPRLVDFIIGTEGIVIDDTFFDYDDFTNFSIIFKPAEDLKVLYLTHHGFFRPRYSIQMDEMDPIEVRNLLIRYLKEDLDRTDESNTDFFARILKI